MANINATLSNAKKVKNDEFYTQLSDIENELKHYKDHFSGKVVYCNCDDARESNFFRFFQKKFKAYGLKKLITTSYNENGHGSVLVYEGDLNDNGVLDENEIKVTELKGNGDFRSEECVEFLKEADIVVTNPPFSLFRDYIAQLVEYDKKFLVIGNLNAITYKEIFPLLKENKMWMGYTYFQGGAAYFIGDASQYDETKISNPKNAYVKDGKLYWRVNGVRWFTNLEHSKRHEKICLWKHYTPEDYPKYDNYDAIEVSKVVEIPVDYDGIMGVPISFFDKYNPSQFEIVDINPHFYTIVAQGLEKPKQLTLHSVNKKDPYARILIRKKN